jgi:hypothetical protein
MGAADSREVLMGVRISSLDVVMLTYDEANKEENWADLLSKVPWAKRVDGVKGFDAAHKAAANESMTDYFITVDGDNVVDPEFFDQTLPDELMTDRVLSWSGRNVINGLIYGNGGLKIWPKATALAMRTHEDASDESTAVEFCWGIQYQHMRGCYSETRPNGDEYQAFRAGFREGVKLSLDKGKRVAASEVRARIEPINLRRLLIWCSVGLDVKGGLSATTGARLGACRSLLEPGWDHTIIRDYEAMRRMYEDLNMITENEGSLYDMKHIIGLDVAHLDANASKFFKAVYLNPSKSFVEVDP